MGEILLLSLASCDEENRYRALPLFYMEDYSEMGLVVNRFKGSVEILKQHRFSIIPKNDGAVIVLNHYGELPGIVEILENQGISCEISDVANRIYQG